MRGHTRKKNSQSLPAKHLSNIFDPSSIQTETMPDSDATRSSAHTRLSSTGSKCAIDQDTHIAANTYALPYAAKANRSAPSSQLYSQYSRTTHINDLARQLSQSRQSDPQTRQTSPPDDSRLLQPPHNNRACFTSNISILNARKPCFCAICLVCGCF